MNAPHRFRSASTEVVRVLLLDDDPGEEALIRKALSELDQVVLLERIDNLETFRAVLAQGGFRIVLADCSRPGINGLAALAMLRERDPDLPFIIVTESLSEEQAVAYFRKQATDYVSKSRLASLPLAIERALRGMDQARRAREAEERARILVESAPDAIFTVDRKGRIQGANRMAQRLIELSEEEILGKLASVYLPAAWIQQLDGTARYVPESGGASFEGRAREIELCLPDGRRLPVELSVSEFQARGRTFRACFVRDLSDRRRMEEQLRQAQKMEAIGSLAAGIAHDFNNVLAVVTGYAELVLESLPQGSEAHQHIEQIRFAGDHAAALTRQLLAFSRRQVLTLERLNMADLVHKLAPLLQRTLGEEIRLEVRTEAPSGDVLADDAQMQQVLFNLAINARDAMPGGGLLRVEVADVEFDATEASRRVGLAPGRYVKVSVTDTGVGMSREVQERVFEPFFTTKAAGRGTGIGLATVLGIVQQSGGQVWFATEPGAGTTFDFVLPRFAADPGAIPSLRADPAAAAAASAGGELILLVEDDKQVREVVSRILRAAGYRLVAFASASEALASLQEPEVGSDFPALLLTDLVMPDMGGDELAEILSARRPGLRILFMSGYSEELVAGRVDKLAHFHHIGKPFGAQTLRDTVRRMLDAPDA